MIHRSSYVQTSFESQYKELPASERLGNLFRTIYNSSLFYLSVTPRVIRSLLSTSSEVERSWKEDNQGLFMIIPGLSEKPHFFSISYLEQIEKDHPGKYEIRVPNVVNTGNCSLEDAAEPILKTVLDYIEKNPGKPINLIGTSNGGRIAAYIETHLRNKHVSIRLTGIAGIFFGSQLMTQADRFYVTRLLFHPEIVEDFKEGSAKAQELIQKMQEPLLIGERSYEFYATANDSMIPNFSSCFPNLPEARYHLLTGQDHASLGSSIQSEELARAYSWMEEHQSASI
jgi:hypothetical protein